MRGADYVLKRVAFALMTVLVAITLNFVIFRAAPGDATSSLAKCRQCTPEFRDALREELGLDKSKLEQYWIYVGDLARGDLGQSFATRQRMLNFDGDASNQVVWFTDARPAVAFDQTAMAFEVIDEWMANIAAHPSRSVGQNKPARAVDSCFDTQGSLIASGRGVWNGVLDSRPAGACTEQFPIYSSSRRQAGGPYAGGVWKCQLQSVGRALRSGLYGSWTPTPEERARLEQTFPTGVCDFTKPDAAKPRHR